MDILVIKNTDNVGTALNKIVQNESGTFLIDNEHIAITAREEIPFGFKIALADIKQGDPIYKYGEIIGLASREILKGEQVHIHNCEGVRGRGDIVRSHV